MQNKSQKIRFSVITAVYNRPDVVGRCIESVNTALSNATETKNFDIELEHIVVNDGSSDNTLEVVKSYDYAHLKVIDLAVNRGANAARNAAIASADSDYCIFLDSDDYFVFNAVSIITREIIEHPDHGHYLFADDDMTPYYSSNPLLNRSRSSSLIYTDFLGGKVGGDFAHVAKTRIAKSHPFDEKLRIYEHIVMMLYFKSAEKILFTNEVTTLRERDRHDAITREAIRFNKKAIASKIAGIKSQLDTLGEDYDTYGFISEKEALLSDLADNYTLLNERGKALETLSHIKNRNKKHMIIKMINQLCLGSLYRKALTIYLKNKYR